MSIEGWNAVTAAFSGAWYLAKAASQYNVQSSSISLELSKLVESISGSVAIATLAMRPEGTKIAIRNNRIEFDKPVYIVQGAFRTLEGSSHEDFKRHELGKRCIDVPHTWYKIGSEEAKAIAKIHKITILGLAKLMKLYDKTSAADLIKVYIEKAQKFISANEEAASEIEFVDYAGDSKPNSEKSLPAFEEAQLDESADESEKSQPVLEKSLSKPEEAAIASGSEKESSLMKQLWKLEDLLVCAKRLHKIYEKFEVEGYSARVQKDLDTLMDTLEDFIELFQKNLMDDMKARY